MAFNGQTDCPNGNCSSCLQNLNWLDFECGTFTDFIAEFNSRTDQLAASLCCIESKIFERRILPAVSIGNMVETLVFEETFNTECPVEILAVLTGRLSVVRDNGETGNDVQGNAVSRIQINNGAKLLFQETSLNLLNGETVIVQDTGIESSTGIYNDVHAPVAGAVNIKIFMEVTSATLSGSPVGVLDYYFQNSPSSFLVVKGR